MRLYLDNCCFNRPFDDQTQIKINLETQAKLAIQSMILDKKHTLVWSYMLEYENMFNPYDIRRESIIKWKELAEIIVNENEVILSTANNLTGQGLKAKDAIHVACAIHSNCDYMITTDMGIIKKNIELIKIVDPLDFIRETEGL